MFDTLSGADAANVTPTPFSGGSRVIVYGLLSLRQMIAICAACYAVGLGIGLYLAIERGFWPIVGIGAAGAFVSLAYTAPPFRLVHHGLGEIASPEVSPLRKARLGPCGRAAVHAADC